jgi:proteasome lid subunit RPN8/RPN11
MADPIEMLKEKYRQTLHSTTAEFVISYKGKLWEGMSDRKGNIHAVSPASLLRSELTIKPGDFRIVMPLHWYKLLIRNTHAGKTEAAGVFFGKRLSNGIHIDYVLNMRLQVAAHELGSARVKIAQKIGGVAGTIAAPGVDALIGRRQALTGHRAVGFYHTHPTSDPFSPGDIKELSEMKRYPNLREPSRLHVLCRRSGLVRTPLLSRFVLLPRAHYQLGAGLSVRFSYKEVPIVIPLR